MTKFRTDALTLFRLHPATTDEGIEHALAEHLADLVALQDKTMRTRARQHLARILELDPLADDDQILAAVHARLNADGELDEHAASEKLLELASARAKETGQPLTGVLHEVAREHPQLADRVHGGPYRLAEARPSSMSHNNNTPGDLNRAPAPARPATALGTAESKIREHAALTGQTDRTAIIRDLLMSGLSSELKDALRRLLAQENPRAALAELTEQRVAETQLSYVDAALEISREQPELVERARP
jgi:hypothetical protein